jgi:hypothetical protein
MTFRSPTAALSCALLFACGGGGGDDDVQPGDPDARAIVVPDARPPADANPNFGRLTPRGRYELAVAGDVAADPARSLVAISEWYAGAVTLVDVSDPDAPAQLSRLDGIGYNSDVQIKGDRLYVNYEPVEKGSPLGTGIRIFDISDPTAPVPTGTVGEGNGHPGLVSCHNTWPQPDRDLLYCASTATGHLIVMSTGETGAGTPDAPVFIAALDSPTGECQVPHDMYARGDRLYVAWLCDGFEIYDITAPNIPVRKAWVTYPDAFTHNLWPTAGDEYLLTTDETTGGHTRVWDIRDLDAIEEVAAFAPVPTAIVHNVEISGTIAFVAHYTAGVYALDLTDPRAPVAIDGHDFVGGPDILDGEPFTALRGAWGVEPALPFVYVSDTESGLRIYELTE